MAEDKYSSESLIVVKFIPTQRHNRRIFERESQFIHSKIDPIEDDFYTYLFEDNDLNYSEIYTYFLDFFISQVQYINYFHKLKMIKVNEHYFSNLFGKVENEK